MKRAHTGHTRGGSTRRPVLDKTLETQLIGGGGVTWKREAAWGFLFNSVAEVGRRRLLTGQKP